ncbi:hypothetical protein [Microvirga zambiensis]|uniref:hypothetical protein n=1 Tax=Microvirga zambiensis TaxID=1402137 RepID=UPI00191E8695|nr:hypothetical protein [Microvirga zambiensis]
MNPGEAAPQILDLPGQPTVWRTTNLPPRRIELPYLVRMQRWRMAVLLVLGLPLLPLVWIIAPIALISAALEFDEAPFTFLKIVLGLVIFLPFLMAISEGALIALRGVFHKGHHAGFDAEKFWHFQLVDPIAFHDIRRLEVHYLSGEPLDLCITTGQPVRLRFRSFFNRRKVRSRSVDETRFVFSSKILSGDKFLIPDALRHLVETKGGTVERKSAFSLWREIFLPWF